MILGVAERLLRASCEGVPPRLAKRGLVAEGVNSPALPPSASPPLEDAGVENVLEFKGFCSLDPPFKDVVNKLLPSFWNGDRNDGTCNPVDGEAVVVCSAPPSFKPPKMRPLPVPFGGGAKENKPPFKPSDPPPKEKPTMWQNRFP